MKKLLLLAAVWSAMTVAALAQGAAMPCVVATTSLTNRTHGTPPTPFFTPATDGMFRISAYLGTTKAATNSAGTWLLLFRWNDGVRHRNTGTAAASASSNAGNATIVVYAVAGQPLEYRTSIVGGTAEGMKYDLHIVVEQLE
jgi:hypothetical protein